MARQTFEIAKSDVIEQVKSRLDWMAHISESEMTKAEWHAFNSAATRFLNVMQPLVELYIDGTPKAEATRYLLKEN